MIVSLIAAGISAASSIYGHMKASEAARKAKREAEEQRRANRAWYERRYNEDATQRADAQRILTKTAERVARRNQAAMGTQAVMGGTDESLAATKEANNRAIAEATSQIAAMGDRRKDAIEAQYRNRDASLGGQLAQIEQNRANAIANATQGVGQVGASLISADFDDMKEKKQETGTPTLKP